MVAPVPGATVARRLRLPCCRILILSPLAALIREPDFCVHDLLRPACPHKMTCCQSRAEKMSHETC